MNLGAGIGIHRCAGMVRTRMASAAVSRQCLGMGLALIAVFVLLACSQRLVADDLASRFASPPDSAKPWAYWWWLDSYATKEGITKDLEEMKRQGISGVLLFDAGEGKGSPVGPVFMSPAWRELFAHAIGEANRLGIEVSANLCSGWNAGGTWVRPEHATKKLVYSETQVQGPAEVSRDLPKPPILENFYRDIAVVAFETKKKSGQAAGLKNWELKSANKDLMGQPLGGQYDEELAAPGEEECRSGDVIDLSQKLDSTGRLTWKAPAGNWTVLRFGYTLLGSKTKCTSPGAIGYEIDFFSPEVMDLHFAETAEKMLADAGPLAGKTLKYFHIDSYESGQPTWTPKFRAEFHARRGYDLLPYLPVLAKKIVDSRENSNRFLWDYRRTIGDLFASNFYGRFRELSHKRGIGTHPESGGPFWPHIDALECVGLNDIPMGEFWKRMTEPDGEIWWTKDYPICDTVKQAATAAHIYGKPVAQAEAFTSMGPNWEEDPFMLKDIGDKALCAGLTRNVLCFYVHQPRLDIKPGYQWEAAGTHFDRNITWWDQIHAWLTYLSRCQHLLKQGLFVADVCYYYGEDAPNFVPAKTHMKPALPRGYDCDTINADVLLNRVRVADGRLVLPDGMSYRLLAIPERTTMSPRVLQRIKKLVEAGATVVGPKPRRAPGLSDLPRSDDEVKRLAADVWGNVDGQAVKQRSFGKGRVIFGKSIAEVLSADGIAPDFDYRAAKDAELDFIHRGAKGLDIYFVSNPKNREETAECVFRVHGKQPEIWDAVTGKRWEAADCREEGGRTVVPLQFAPRQSWFVVFRKPLSGQQAVQKNFPALTNAGELSGPWTVRFDPKWGGPESVVFDRLADWTKRPEAGIRYYSGKATYQKTFDLPESLRAPGRAVYLDLGTVKNLAEVRLNGKNLGVVWTAPWRVEVSGAVKSQGNVLEIDVVNLWPNRLIGDAALPPEKRLTVTNVQKFKKGSPLLESGLLGPVTLLATEKSAPKQAAIDPATLDRWSAPYRGWHYWPDHVIAANPKIEGHAEFVNTDCPCVYQLPGSAKWYMSFIGFNGKGYNSFVAESDDLVHWTKPRLAMGFGPAGEFDHGGRAIGAFLYESYDIKAPRLLKQREGKFWSLYGCYPRQGGYELRPGYEGVASSEDGLVWKRAKQGYILSVHEPDVGSWEKDCIYQPWLVEHEGRFYNFYNAANGGIEQTGLAKSSDLLNWTRHSANPVIRNRKGGYDEEFASDPKVFRDGDHWTMFYFGVGRGGAHIMVAFSRDLLNWTAHPEPLYKAGGNPSGLDKQYAHKISLVHNPKNDAYYLYYCACGAQGRGIGLITSKPIAPAPVAR